MKKLKEYSTEELSTELENRNQDLAFKKWNKLVPLKYKYKDELNPYDSYATYLVIVHTGSEPLEYIINCPYIVGEGCILNEEEILEYVKHSLFKDNPAEEFGFHVESMDIEEIGRYGLTFLTIKNE